jgi:hypothetical protein
MAYTLITDLASGTFYKEPPECSTRHTSHKPVFPQDDCSAVSDMLKSDAASAAADWRPLPADEERATAERARVDELSAELARMMKRGFTMLDDVCSECSTPLVGNASVQRFCIACRPHFRISVKSMTGATLVSLLMSPVDTVMNLKEAVSAAEPAFPVARLQLVHMASGNFEPLDNAATFASLGIVADGTELDAVLREVEQPTQAAVLVKTYIEFPPSTGVSCNMMPVRIGDHASFPPEFRQYAPLVDACEINQEEHGQIGYLTVTESTVLVDGPQRRGGIHTESPGALPRDARYSNEFDKGQGGNEGIYRWGCGIIRGYEKMTLDPSKPRSPWSQGRSGGIYMASTVDASCQVWDTFVKKPGELGSCEHLRDELGPGHPMFAGELWWITDRTPHEALPIAAGTHRQYFRFVTNQLSMWYSQHNTPNPLGIQPDCAVSHENKFRSVAFESAEAFT